MQHVSPVGYNTTVAQTNWIGFVLPLDEKGMPAGDTYSATSAFKIAQNFETGNVTSLAYVIIAQLLIENAPSFC